MSRRNWFVHSFGTANVFGMLPPPTPPPASQAGLQACPPGSQPLPRQTADLKFLHGPPRLGELSCSACRCIFWEVFSFLQILEKA